MHAPLRNGYPDSFDSLLESIAISRTSYDIFKALKEIASLYEMEYFAAARSQSRIRGDVASLVMLSNWDSEALHRCVEVGLLDAFGIDKEVQKSVLPSSGRSGEKTAREDGAPDMGDFMQAHGHGSYAFFPLRSSSGHEGVILLSRTRDPATRGELMEMNFLLQHAFEFLTRILDGADAPHCPLSKREQDCLTAAAAGLSAAQTADRLGITTHTVNYHTVNAVRKLDARNKTHAVAKALDNGWLDPDARVTMAGQVSREPLI